MFLHLKLKTRLIIAFFTIILVPVLLTAVALLGFGNYQLRSMKETYGISGEDYGSLANSVQFLSRLTIATHDKIQEKARTDGSELESEAYLSTVNNELYGKYSYILARRGDTLIYNGSDKDVSEIFEHLPEYGNYDSTLEGGVYLGGEVQALVKQIDFNCADGEPGSVFIITSAEAVIPQVRSFAFDMMITIILILVCTSAVLTSWIYRSVASPLKKLKAAAQNIKEGNLDFTIEPEADDEIGELCMDFEEMRQRLKITSEEKLQFDQQNKELISNISHDLKTPITAVKGYVEGIMDGVADTPEKIDKYIKTIYNKANDMDRLINELTFYSKIDTDRIPYTFNKINVNNYFNDCIEEVGLDLEAKNIELAYFNYVSEDVVIIADAEQLKRVINNIINNSVKYIDKSKGYINIRVKDVGDFIQVEIEDNGKGISNKDLPFVFDRFYRTDASRNSSKGGSGIGLSIVKKVIEDHGGKIWATSKEGTGTVMYFVLRKYQEVPVDE